MREESGLCHIGIDGFLADVAGSVDGVTFVTLHGTHCPALALTIHGVEWPMSFPNPLMIQKSEQPGAQRSGEADRRSLRRRMAVRRLGIAGPDAGRPGLGTASGGMAGRGTDSGWHRKSTRRMRRAAMAARRCAAWRSCYRGQHLVCLLQHFFSKQRLDGGGMSMSAELRSCSDSGWRRAGWRDGWYFRACCMCRKQQPVEFRHKTHAEKSGVADCNECHALREDGAFAGIPAMEKCAGCHSERIGESKAEATLVDNYIKPGHETPWLVYARQPANVWFSHAIHVKRGGPGLYGMPFDVRRVGSGESL